MPRFGLVLSLVATAAAVAADPEPVVKLHLEPTSDLNEPGKKTADAEAQRTFKIGLVAMAKGDLNSARDDFLKVLQTVPDSVPTTFRPHRTSAG
jgi:hypothetical protein